jgi:hypothetical protein
LGASLAWTEVFLYACPEYACFPESSMLEMKYALLVELNSRLHADLLESYLEAHGIDVELFQESIGWHIYPVAINGLGSTQVFVPRNKLKDAGKLYDEFNLQEKK